MVGREGNPVADTDEGRSLTHKGRVVGGTHLEEVSA